MVCRSLHYRDGAGSMLPATIVQTCGISFVIMVRMSLAPWNWTASTNTVLVELSLFLPARAPLFFIEAFHRRLW